jgi:hypothetical protein
MVILVVAWIHLSQYTATYFTDALMLAWVHWYNARRLMHRLGRRPPAEAEAEYYAQHQIGQHTITRNKVLHETGDA